MRFFTKFNCRLRLPLNCSLYSFLVKLVTQKYYFEGGSFLQFFFVYLSGAVKKVTALADAPREWQIGFQDPSISFMENLICLHNTLLIVFLFVILLLDWLIDWCLYLYIRPKSLPNNIQISCLKILFSIYVPLFLGIGFLALFVETTDSLFFINGICPKVHADNAIILKNSNTDLLESNAFTKQVNKKETPALFTKSHVKFTPAQQKASITNPCPPDTKVNWEGISNNWDLWMDMKSLNRKETERLYDIVYPNNEFNPYKKEHYKELIQYREAIASAKAKKFETFIVDSVSIETLGLSTFLLTVLAHRKSIVFLPIPSLIKVAVTFAVFNFLWDNV